MKTKEEQAVEAGLWAATWVNNYKWTFAKTMSAIPHEWLLSKNMTEEEKKDFTLMCLAIDYYGKPQRFFSRTFIYLEVGDYKYWIMEPPREADLINRARKELNY